MDRRGRLAAPSWKKARTTVNPHGLLLIYIHLWYVATELRLSTASSSDVVHTTRVIAFDVYYILLVTIFGGRAHTVYFQSNFGII